MSGSREDTDWLNASTDNDLHRQLDSSSYRREILDLVADLSPEGWVTFDVCEPKEGQLIFLMMDNWDKPSSGTYADRQVHLYGDRYISVPRNPKAFFWMPCELPPGLPKKRDIPQAPRPASNPAPRRDYDNDNRGNREHSPRPQYTAPMDHRYNKDEAVSHVPDRGRATRRDHAHRDKNRNGR